MILSREEYIPNALRLQRYYYLDGKRVGDVGNGGPSRVDYVQALAQGGVNKTGPRSFSPISSADFDQNYEPINVAYPGSTPSGYIVRAGDTLRSIAAQLWGDASMWYLIADANGLTGTEVLTVGISLTIPNKLANFHNSSETFRVYHPGEAIGDITPNIPIPPPPPQDDDWGIFGIIAVIVVAAVVTVFSAGTMTAAAGSSFSTIMSAGTAALGSNIGVSLVAGAVGGAVSQVAGIAMGMQDSLSWTGVALSSLGAGVGAGIGGSGAGAAAAKAIGLSSQVAIAATSQFLGNFVTQGLATAAGLQRKFDWRSVAIATLGAVAGSVIGEALKSSGAAPAMMGSSLASGVVRAAMGGNWTAVAAATIGNVVAESVVRESQGPSQSELELQQREDARDAELTRLLGSAQDADNIARAQRFSMNAIVSNDVADPSQRKISSDIPSYGFPIPNLNDYPDGVLPEYVVRPDPKDLVEDQSSLREKAPLPAVYNLYGPVSGYFQGVYGRAQQGLKDPNASVADKVFYALAGTAALPLAMLEAPAVEAINSVNNAYLAGQAAAKYRLTGEAGDLSAALYAGSSSILGLATPASLVPTRSFAGFVGSGDGAAIINQRGAIGFKGESGTLFENQLPAELKGELRLAKEYGITPTHPIGAKFDAMINQGTVKFAVTDSGDLLVVPKFTSDGKEISHAVIAGGRPVRAAGEAEIFGGDRVGYLGADINTHSGHYLNGATKAQNLFAEQVARQAFQKFGIHFAP